MGVIAYNLWGNKVLALVRRRQAVRPLLERGAVLECHVDDVGLGTNTAEDHLVLLKEFLDECKINHIRVRLEKCEFLKEDMEYLGFTIGWGWWRPSESRTSAINETKVKSVQDLRAFLGACNFLRSHIKNFTETSAELTELLKKEVPWRWTEKHQGLIEELKKKILSKECLGVPRSRGDFVVVTDASDLGGGGSIFQWQVKAVGKFATR